MEKDMIRCPICKSDDITGGIGLWDFTMENVPLKATYVTYKCEDCMHRFIDATGATVQKLTYENWLKRNQNNAKNATD